MWEQVYEFMDNLAEAAGGHEYLRNHIKHVGIMINPYFIGNNHASVVLHLTGTIMKKAELGGFDWCVFIDDGYEHAEQCLPRFHDHELV